MLGTFTLKVALLSMRDIHLMVKFKYSAANCATSSGSYGVQLKHVQIYGAAGIRKWADQGGFDELRHAKALHARLITKEDHLWSP